MFNRSSSAETVVGKKTAPGSLFIFFLCLFWLTNCGFDTSEAINHYKVAVLFVETGNIGFDEPVKGVFTTAPNGRTYASHEFGNILLLIPTAAVNSAAHQALTSRGIAPERVKRAQQFVVSLQSGIYAALTLMFLYLILVEEFSLTTGQAFAGCLWLGTCSFFWAYSRSLFDGLLCALLLTAALRYLLRYRRLGGTFDAYLCFSLLGFAVDTRLSLALPTVAALVFVVLFCSGRRVYGLVVAVLALAPFAVWQLWYNHLRTGNPLVSPVQTPQYAVNNGLDGDLAEGIVGLLVSPGKSVFVYAPLLLLSIGVFPWFWKRHRPAAVFIIMLGTSWFLLHAKLRSWYGAWGWGPRLFLTVLPVLAIPALASAPALWEKRLGRIVIAITAVAGFLVALVSIIGNWHFRMELRLRAGTLDDASFIWKFAECQSIDMCLGAIDNIQVVIGTRPPVVVPEASDLNNYASNHINVWWYTLPWAGIPWSVVLIAAGGLLTGMVVSSTRLLRKSTTRAQLP
jgi:hypothetical protein